MTLNLEWRKVICSDEKKLNIDAPDGFAFYWHDIRKEELIFSRRKMMGGGSVMIWAFFAYDYKSRLTFIEQTIKAIDYQQMVGSHLEDIQEAFQDDDNIYQRINCPIHTPIGQKRGLQAKTSV